MKKYEYTTFGVVLGCIGLIFIGLGVIGIIGTLAMAGSGLLSDELPVTTILRHAFGWGCLSAGIGFGGFVILSLVGVEQAHD